MAVTEREKADARFAALAALPWARTADGLPEWARETNKRFLVLTAPVSVPGATGRLSAQMAFAFYRGRGRWEWCGPMNIDRSDPVVGQVMAWLDTSGWDLDRLAAHLGSRDAA